MYNTEKPEIINLFEIYQWVKYFYFDIIQDIRPSILNLNKSYNETETIIKQLINPLELEQYFKYREELETEYNISLPVNIQSLIFNCEKWFRIIKNSIKLKLGLIDTLTFHNSNALLRNFSDAFYIHYKNIYDTNEILSLYEYIGIFNKNETIFYNALIKFSDIKEDIELYKNLYSDIKNYSLQLIKPNDYNNIITELKHKYNL